MFLIDKDGKGVVNEDCVTLIEIHTDTECGHIHTVSELHSIDIDRDSWKDLRKQIETAQVELGKNRYIYIETSNYRGFFKRKKIETVFIPDEGKPYIQIKGSSCWYVESEKAQELISYLKRFNAERVAAKAMRKIEKAKDEMLEANQESLDYLKSRIDKKKAAIDSLSNEWARISKLVSAGVAK